MFRSTICLGIITLFLVFTTAHSQNIRGNLEGKVRDVNANPLPAVNISVSGEVSHIGHQTAKYENVSIRLGRTTTLGEVRLTAKTIELAAVVVTRSKPVIDPNSTTVSANISAAQFEALPTGRDYLSITTLLPQANASFLGDDVNIGGATGGIVNVITYSGGNKFEAKAFGFFTDNSLADDGRRGLVDLGTGRSNVTMWDSV